MIGPECVHTKKGVDKWFKKLPFEENTRFVLSKSEVPVGILLNKNLAKTDKVFIPVFETGDSFLIRYAQKLISNSDSQITVFDVAGSIKDSEVKETKRAIEHKAPNHINLLLDQEFDASMLQIQDWFLSASQAGKSFWFALRMAYCFSLDLNYV